LSDGLFEDGIVEYVDRDRDQLAIILLTLFGDFASRAQRGERDRGGRAGRPGPQIRIGGNDDSVMLEL